MHVNKNCIVYSPGVFCFSFFWRGWVSFCFFVCFSSTHSAASNTLRFQSLANVSFGFALEFPIFTIPLTPSKSFWSAERLQMPHWDAQMQIVFVSFLLGDHRLRWQRWQGRKKNVLANQMSHFLQKIKDFVMTHRKEKTADYGSRSSWHWQTLMWNYFLYLFGGGEGMNVFHFQNEFMSP